jgi:dolichol-phosphate mannosyltransferase
MEPGERAPDRDAPRLSVIVPTRNEAGNVGRLREALRRSLTGINHEVVIVDDSTDGVTRRVLRSLAARDPAVRIIERGPGQTGLATAVALGISLARGAALCVMDGDLQHPPDAVPRLLAEVEAGADLAVGSRYVSGGASDGLDGTSRRVVSRAATWAALALFPEARRTTDPLSGFFCVRRDAIAGLEFRPLGYKILLELLVLCPELRIVDAPFVFGRRAEGRSKAGVSLGALFLRHLASLFLDVPRSARTLKFAFVTALSLAIFLASFSAISAVLLPRWLTWLLASAASSILNGLLQRRLTFPNRNRAALLYRALGVSGSVAGLGVYLILNAVDHRHALLTAAIAQAFALAMPLVLNLPTLRRWRGALAGTSGGNLDYLRRLVRADAAWYVSGNGKQTSPEWVVFPWTRLEDHIRQCAATQVPDLIIQSPSPRPQPRRNIEMVSAILVPDPGTGAVVVLVRQRRKPFRPGDLGLAIAWLYEHRPDGAAEPLVVGVAGL